MSILIHDGSANSQTLWTEEAIAAGVAHGAIISPFCTPWVGRPQQPSADQFADRVRAAGGEVIVDASTHATNLSGTTNWTNYNSWSLWAGRRGDLSTWAARADHVSRVFARQRALGAPSLTPTLTLDNAVGGDADVAYELARSGATEDPGAWQSLAGRRGLWLSPDLDTYVGALAQLRAPVWVISQVRESPDYPADSSEAAQIEAFLRTIDSLSRRSRVIVAHSDLAGLPGIAAGARDIGSGWHGKHRILSTTSFQAAIPGQVRRQAIWYTYELLMGRLHSNESDPLARTDRALAESLYTGTVATGSGNIRLHHLSALNNLVGAVAASADRPTRVATLRALYESAAVFYDSLARTRGRAFSVQRVLHVDNPYEGLRAYAQAEGSWLP